MSAVSIIIETIESRLNRAARDGDIEAFYSLIWEKVNILEDIDKIPFIDTPLHTSASAGHFSFSLEMIILKPSFVSKRNLYGFTPINLALHNGHTEMVRQLLQHNTDLVRVKGREYMTALHYTAAVATTNGHLALLENFLYVCPDSITDVTVRNETALHIALKCGNLEAFKFLVGWLIRKWDYWKILKLKDVEGNTLLHIAVSKNQSQAVSLLLALRRRFVELEINDKNFDGKTAWDMLQEQPQGVDNSAMRVKLKRAGALTASSLPTVTSSSYAHYLRLPGVFEVAKLLIFRKRLTGEKRNALLVVAALLVTVTYQAVITPPGGLWQDDLFESNITGILPRTADDRYKVNITAPHRAGSAIAKETGLFATFFALNSAIFVLSNVIMIVLVPPVNLIGYLLTLVCRALCICYLSSLLIIIQAPDWTATIVIRILEFGYMVALAQPFLRAGGWTRILGILFIVYSFIYCFIL